MHIPDGYLSPSTCALLYGTAIPFWYTAFARVKRLLNTRLIPLLAVASAFCFVIMMFNVPLPGGTTGHAVGVGAATVVLGPWASMLSVSIALLIQAVFFGDGGITTFGANCFNMAIVGSAGGAFYLPGSGGQNSNRVPAPGCGGWVGRLCRHQRCRAAYRMRVGNSAAVVQGRERGSLICSLCPSHRDSGDDAGPSDLCRIGGAVCRGRSGGVSAAYQSCIAGAEICGRRQRRMPLPAEASGWRTTRPLWIRLALLMLLTPLGILAAGTAWGEWGAKDFSDPQMRQQIAAASGQVAPPSEQPRGLARLSSLWSAPFPQYAPPFVRHPAFGYVMSAMFGCGLILGFFLLVGWMIGKRDAVDSGTSP